MCDGHDQDADFINELCAKLTQTFERNMSVTSKFWTEKGLKNRRKTLTKLTVRIIF